MQVKAILLLIFIFGPVGCSPKDQNDENSSSLPRVGESSDLSPNLFLADIDGIPWVLAVYRNDTTTGVSVDLEPVYNMLSYKVTLRETGEEVSFVSNLMQSPNSDSKTIRMLYISPSQSVFLLVGMPPVDFDEASCLDIYKKYQIMHEDYGNVELFGE